jgi:hypothetical protein
MYIEYLYWKDHLVDKIIERHGVMPKEVEEVIRDMSELEKRAFKRRHR